MSKTLAIGDKASITRRFSAEDVKAFAQVSSDFNPVHLDEAVAADTQFGQRIVHGMLVSSLFSALLGTELPGEGSIYMSQNLKFKAPVFLDMEVIASVEITDIHARRPIVSLKTQVVDAEGKVLIEGDAVMYVPWFERE